MFGNSVKSFSIALVASLAFALPATAATMVSSVDNGLITRSSSSIGISTGTGVSHNPNNQGRAISNTGGLGGVSGVTAGYFIFDLSGFVGTVTTATLNVQLAAASSVSTTFDLNFYTVSASASAFDLAYNESSNSFSNSLGVPPLGPGNALFNDISSGQVAGQGSLPNPGGGSPTSGPLSINLTADGLAALNASVGSSFILGFATSNLGGATVNSEVLSIEGIAPVPVPLSGALLLSAMGGMVMVRRRKNRATA